MAHSETKRVKTMGEAQKQEALGWVFQQRPDFYTYEALGAKGRLCFRHHRRPSGRRSYVIPIKERGIGTGLESFSGLMG